MTGANAVGLAASRVGALGLQAVSLFLLARALQPYDLGIFSLALLVQSLISVVANVGLFTASQYHVGTGRFGVQRVAAASLLGTVVAAVLIVPPASFVLSWLHPVLLPGLRLDLLVLAIMAGPVRLAYEALLVS